MFSPEIEYVSEKTGPISKLIIWEENKNKKRVSIFIKWIIYIKTEIYIFKKCYIKASDWFRRLAQVMPQQKNECENTHVNKKDCYIGE